MAKDLFRFYFSFNGRATRRDFNVRYAVVAILGSVFAAILDFVFAGGDIYIATQQTNFSNIWNLLLIIPTFALMCRRLHDMNFSGWWQLPIHITACGIIVVILLTFGMAFLTNPLIAGITGFLGVLGILFGYLGFFIMLSAKRGTKGPNRFGPDLLEVTHVE